jgi:hypothetical protein
MQVNHDFGVPKTREALRSKLLIHRFLALFESPECRSHGSINWVTRCTDSADSSIGMSGERNGDTVFVSKKKSSAAGSLHPNLR